jgi:hypothetical protein
LLYVNITIPFGIALYFAITHQHYTWVEFSAQVALTMFILIGFFFIGYSAQDITTTSYNSGKVNSIVFEEEWTELVHYTESYSCGTSKSPRTCYRPRTRQDFHPDDFYLTHDFGTTNISESQYNLAKLQFGDSQTDSDHSGQISSGDGRTYTAIPNKIIPVVDTESGINYVYAAKSNIIKSFKHKDLEKQYAKELTSYPSLYEEANGNYTFERLINGHLINPVDRAKLNKELYEYASIRGAVKEVNPIIYFTTATDREFTYVVKGFYRDAHKNDAVLVVSVDKNGTVNWTDSFGFTKSAEFLVANRNIDKNVSTLANMFIQNVEKHWKRTPMEEYKYLSGEIDLPLGFEIFLVMLNLIGSFVLFRLMLINTESKGGFSHDNYTKRFWGFIPSNIRQYIGNIFRNGNTNK